MHPSEKIFQLDRLAVVCAERRAAGEIIVLTSGCFDLLHGGHLEYICEAGEMGFLVVGINSNLFVKRLKGESRPIRDENDRAFTMAGFYPVKCVTIFDCDYELIGAVKPNIYIASSTSHIRVQNDSKRVALLDGFGAKIIEIGSKKKDSTTNIIRRAAMA